jgi:glycosyltransferase involved in cell wall biosynthesis
MRGDQLRAYHLARALARRADVTLLHFGAEPGAPIEGVRQRAVGRGPLGALMANLGAPDPLLPAQVRLYLDRAMQSAVRAQMDEAPPDVLHVTLARLGPYSRRPPAGVHVHVDFVDALSLNMDTRAGRSRFPARAAFALEARLMRRYEARLAGASHSSSVVSERDRQASPGLRRAVVIPNGVAVEELAYRPPVERPPTALFFGNLGYFHNVEPARMVAGEVLPRLRELVPGATLRIAGARPATAVAQLASLDAVEVAADVPDMLLELHGAALAVLPMASGSGMKNKVLEAFAAGTPVVTNRAGIDGVTGAESCVHYIEAEGPEALARACARLLESADERVRIAAAARELVEHDYSWDSRADTLLELYERGRERS